MGVEAAYAINEFLVQKIDDVLNETYRFDPGEPAPKGEGDIFATYRYYPNLDYTQPYIHMDTLVYKVYHTDFDMLAKVVNLILTELNQESVYDNPDLAAAGTGDSIRFHDVIARGSGHSQNDFIDSTEYHVMGVDILLMYVEL